MSINVSISGEIIESQNYLSNYFVTLTGDQTITGTKLFTQITNIENLTNVNVSNLTFTNGQINASSLDISTNLLSFNGNSGISGQFLTSNGSFPIWSNLNQIFGSEDISGNICSGIISFGINFSVIPCVTITQLNSSRLVPIFVTNISNSYFEWGSASKGVGTIMWSAGLKS
jgi:hypothetical protein